MKKSWLLSLSGAAFRRLGGILALSLALWLAASCSKPEDPERVRALAARPDHPTLEAYDIEIYFSQDRAVKIKAVAPKLLHYAAEDHDEPRSVFPEGIKLWFYKDGQLNSSLKANYAIHYELDKLWEAKYQVELLNQDGDVLTTEHLYASEERETMYTQQYVQIVRQDGSTVRGEGGFESSFDFTSYKFHKVDGSFIFKN